MYMEFFVVRIEQLEHKEAWDVQIRTERYRLWKKYWLYVPSPFTCLRYMDGSLAGRINNITLIRTAGVESETYFSPLQNKQYVFNNNRVTAFRVLDKKLRR